MKSAAKYIMAEKYSLFIDFFIKKKRILAWKKNFDK